MQVAGFKDWLKLIEDRTHVQCTICNKFLKSKFFGLKTHAQSKKHYLAAGLENAPPDDDFELPKVTDSSWDIAKAELKFIAACLFNNVPFKNIPNLLESMQNISSDQIFENLNIGATKAHDVCVNVFAKFKK